MDRDPTCLRRRIVWHLSQEICSIRLRLVQIPVTRIQDAPRAEGSLAQLSSLPHFIICELRRRFPLVRMPPRHRGTGCGGMRGGCLRACNAEKLRCRNWNPLEATGLDAKRLDARRLNASRLDARRLDASGLDASSVGAKRRGVGRLDANRLDAQRLDAGILTASLLDATTLDLARLHASNLDDSTATTVTPVTTAAAGASERLRSAWMQVHAERLRSAWPQEHGM